MKNIHLLMKEESNLYNFYRFQDFLYTYYKLNKKYLNSRFTLDKWAQKIGYNSPRVIAMVIKKQRSPSYELKEKMINYFNLRGNKKKYFDLLYKKALLEYKNLDCSDVDKDIFKINPLNLKLKAFDLHRFEYIAEWHNLVIKQLVKLPNFKNEVTWIFKKLKNKISPAKIKDSIKMLKELNLIKSSKDSKTLEPVNEVIIGGKNIPSSAIKRHHIGMIERSKEALIEDDIESRHFSAATLNFNRSDISDARKMIDEFLFEFDSRFGNNNGSDVYQINLQFFSHTRKEQQKSKRGNL